MANGITSQEVPLDFKIDETPVNSEAPQVIDGTQKFITVEEALGEVEKAAPVVEEKTEDSSSRRAQPVSEEKEEKVEEKAEEVTKKEEEAVQEETEKKEVPAAPAEQARPAKRDYSVFTPEQEKLARRLHNDQFAIFHKMATEHKAQLVALTKERDEVASKVNETGLPPTYFNHPQGYVLSPEYQQGLRQENLLGALEDHWTKQLEKIEGNEDWEDFEQNAQGQYLSVNRPASVQAKVAVQRQLQRVAAQRQQNSAKIQSITQTFGSRHSQLNAFVGQIAERLFPTLTDAQLSKPERKTDKQAYDSFLGKLPPEIRDHFSGPLITRALLATVKMAEMLNKERAASQTKTLEKKNDKIAQPTQRSLNGGKAPVSTSNPFDVVNKVLGEA